MNEISGRKKRHLKSLELGNDVGVFDAIKIPYNALPEIDFESLDISFNWLGYDMSFPFFVSSMSGGVVEGDNLNKVIAKVCGEEGVGFASGSIRIAVENNELISAFDLKTLLRDVPYLLNVGAYQLKNLGFRDALLRIIDQLSADGIFIHLNPLQEVVQDGGDSDWSGVLDGIREFVKLCSVPVFVKEVGHGLAPSVIERLAEVGVAGFDVSGRGGLSWGQVEASLQGDNELSEIVADIGCSTPELLEFAHEINPDWFLIAGGGVRSGIDIVKAELLGASLATAASPIIKVANSLGEDGVRRLLRRWRREYQIGLFAMGG